MEYVIIAMAAVIIGLQIYMIFFGKDSARTRAMSDELEETARKLDTKFEVQSSQLTTINNTLGSELERNRRENSDMATKTLSFLSDNLNVTNDQIHKLLISNEKQQREMTENVLRSLGEISEVNRKNNDRLQEAMQSSIGKMQEANEKKLTQIQSVVDEKLTNTLTARLDSSFKTVSDQLQNVYTAMGEMKKLAGGVTDLQRVLTNVKSRGTWAEVQLGNILEQTLTQEQYDRNVKCKPNKDNMVEFAVRLPGKDGETVVWLPIDSKFPVEDYQRLLDASESADRDAADAAQKALLRRISDEAKSIHDLYINPPLTTDFAIMFLATEGLYAEALRAGLAERLQRDHRVVIAGPTTITALLNSLSMGFKTLAIDKHTSEVREILAATKAQYDKFGDVLDKVHKKLGEATKQVESAQTRNRAIKRALKTVERLEGDSSDRLLGIDGEVDEPDDNDVTD